MSDRLGTLLKEAADDSLGDARMQPPTELPEARMGRRRARLAAAAVVILAAGGLGAWALGSGARTVDVDTPPAQEAPPPKSTPGSGDARSALVSAVKRTMAETWEATLGVGGGRPDDVSYQPPDRYRMLASTGEVWVAIGDRHWETRNGAFVELPSDEFVNAFAVVMAALGDPHSAHWVEGLEGALFAEVDAAACAGDQGPVPKEGETCEVQIRLESERVTVIWIEPLRFSGGPNPYIEERVQLTFSVPSSTVPEILPPDESQTVTTTAPLAPMSYEAAPGNWPGLGGPLMMAVYEPGTPMGEIGGLPEALDFLGVDYDPSTPMPPPGGHGEVQVDSNGHLGFYLRTGEDGYEIERVIYIRGELTDSTGEPTDDVFEAGGLSYSAQGSELSIGGCETPRADLAARYGDVEVREVWIYRPCPATLHIDRPMDQPGWIIERYGSEGDLTRVTAYQLSPGDGGAG